MKKTKCPYRDCQNRCTHKTTDHKTPVCIYFDTLKCEYYNELIRKRKSVRIDKTGLQAQVKQGLEMYQRRWIK